MDARIIILISLIALLLFVILKQRERERERENEFDITEKDELEMRQAISDEYIGDIGQRNVLLQGDALEYQRQQIGNNSRTYDYDPMSSSFGMAGTIDKITDTSAFFREAGGVPSKNSDLKVFNPDTGLYELQAPLATLDDGMPGFDTSGKLFAQL